MILLAIYTAGFGYTLRWARAEFPAIGQRIIVAALWPIVAVAGLTDTLSENL